MAMQPMHLSPGGASKQSIRRGEEESGILAGRGVVLGVKMFLQIFYVFQYFMYLFLLSHVSCV